MRLLFPVLALPLLVPAATSAQTPAPTVAIAAEHGSPDRRDRQQLPQDDQLSCAEAASAWRGDPVTPRKLTDLPPAESYKAVYRTVNGCEEPMTVAEYQRGVIR